jgi:hypothetical protein
MEVGISERVGGSGRMQEMLMCGGVKVHVNKYLVVNRRTVALFPRDGALFGHWLEKRKIDATGYANWRYLVHRALWSIIRWFYRKVECKSSVFFGG